MPQPQSQRLRYSLFLQMHQPFCLCLPSVLNQQHTHSLPTRRWFPFWTLLPLHAVGLLAMRALPCLRTCQLTLLQFKVGPARRVLQLLQPRSLFSGRSRMLPRVVVDNPLPKLAVVPRFARTPGSPVQCLSLCQSVLLSTFEDSQEAQHVSKPLDPALQITSVAPVYRSVSGPAAPTGPCKLASRTPRVPAGTFQASLHAEAQVTQSDRQDECFARGGLCPSGVYICESLQAYSQVLQDMSSCRDLDLVSQQLLATVSDTTVTLQQCITSRHVRASSSCFQTFLLPDSFRLHQLRLWMLCRLFTSLALGRYIGLSTA